MRLKRIILLLFMIISAIHINSCSRLSFKKSRYIVATSPSTPPLVMIDKEKDIIGFDIDVIEQIAILADINIKIIPVLKGNLLYGLIDETHDIAIASITHPKGTSPADVLEIEYSKPYLEIGEVLVLSEDFSGFNSLFRLFIKPFLSIHVHHFHLDLNRDVQGRIVGHDEQDIPFLAAVPYGVKIQDGPIRLLREIIGESNAKGLHIRIVIR